jgi:hypothetical protein
MNVPEPIAAKLVISGIFECRDADGNLIKTIELKSEVPLNLTEQDNHGDQRSE